jgi:hypothetical protein
MMNAKLTLAQIAVVRDRIDKADQSDQGQIGHILIALSLLTNIVEQIVKEHNADHTATTERPGMA